MKKLIPLLLALCLVLGLSGCTAFLFDKRESPADRTTSVDDNQLYGHGLELAGLLEEILSSGEYFQLMTNSQEVSDVIMPYIRSDFSDPGSAYKITLSEDAIPLLMGMADVDLDSFSPSLREFLEHRIRSSVPTMLNAQSGSSVLAAASLCTISQTWVGETLEEDCYLLLFYPYACPIVVTFCGGDGYVEGSAMLLLGDNVTEDSLEDVAELFRSLGPEGLHVQKLDIDNF